MKKMERSLGAYFQESTLLSLCMIFFTVAILLLPIWWYGLAVNSHDTKAHAAWQYFFSMQLWNGELYPRWLANMNEGLGSPSFYIYPPLSQYAAAILAPFSDSAAWVYQRLGIAATVAYLTSGIASYFWLLKVTNDRVSALLGAIVFLVSPYHLLTDTYMRAAYAELWSFAWAPFSLLALHLLRENFKKGLIVYTTATAALLLSHAPSCIALLPAYAAYGAVLSAIYKDKRIFLWSLIGIFLAILIAGAYLGTALTHQQYINSAELFSGYFDFFRWFLLSEKRWPSTGIELVITGVAMTQCCAILFFGFLAIKQVAANSMQLKLVWLSIFISCTILFMVSTFSKPIWEILPIAQKIQFPWRLFTTQTIFLALTCAVYVQSMRNGLVVLRVPLLKRLTIPFIFFLIIVNAVLIYFFKPEFDHSSPLRVRDTPEYNLGRVDHAQALFNGSEAIRLIAGQGSVRIEVLAPRYIRIHVDAKSDITFVVRHFYYPDWRCATPSGETSCNVRKFNVELPLITVSTTSGKKQLELELSSTAERIGHLASVVGMVLLISICLFDEFQTRRKKRAAAAALS